MTLLYVCGKLSSLLPMCVALFPYSTPGHSLQRFTTAGNNITRAIHGALISNNNFSPW